MCDSKRVQPYDHSIDIWSIGVLAYELCCGVPPYEEESEQMTRARIAAIDV